MQDNVAKKGIGILLVLLLCASGVSAQTTFFKAYYRVRFGMNPEVANTCTRRNFDFTVTLSNGTNTFPKTFTLTAPGNSGALSIIEDRIYLPWQPIKCNIAVVLPTWINQDITYPNVTNTGSYISYAGDYNNPNYASQPDCQLYLRQAFPIVYQYECTITNTNPQVSYCADETIQLSVTEYPQTVTWEIASDGTNFKSFKTISGQALSFTYADVVNSGVSNPNGVLNLRATVDYGNGTVMHPAVYTGIHYEPPVPGPVSIQALSPTCAGDNGKITLSNFKYTEGSVYNGAIPLVAKFQNVATGDVYTSPAFTASTYTMSLPAGTYQLRITSPASSCIKDMGSTPPVGTAPPALVLSAPVVSCSGGSPAFTLSASGGTAPYTFSIDGVANPDGDNIFTGLAPGTAYTLRVTDANQCKTSLSITTPTIVTAALSSKSDPSIPNAADGSITVTAGGGGGAPYTYSRDGTNWQSSATFNGLTKGTYNIRIRDVYGCVSGNLPVTIQDPQPVTVGAAGITNVSCYELSDGSLTVNASGGTPPYTYSRDGAVFLAINTFTSLPAGNYTLWAKDSKGSTGSANFTITRPPALSITVTARQDALCKGMSNGQIIVSGNGGSGTLRYALNAGAYQPQNSFAIPAGQYTITVMDAKGCSKATPQIDIAEPVQAVTVNVTTTAVNCFGASDGIISANGDNGVPPYQYQLGSGQWQASGIFSNLPAGSYTVNVKDNNGCPGMESNINITQSAALSIVQDVLTDASCFNAADGGIKVSAAGGSGTVQYYISTAPAVPNNTGVFNGLPAGTYTIIAKDEHNCSATLNMQVGQPALLQLSVNGTNATCYGAANGSVSLQATGGTAPYLYSADGVTFGSSSIFSNLSAGNYTYYVKDNHGCIASTAITITEPSPVAFTAIVSDALCHGAATGTITVTAVGGTGTYQYNIDGHPFQPGNVLNNIPAGTHLVGVMDANGCVKTSNVFVDEPPELILQVVNRQAASCFGSSNGSLTVQASGGSGSFEYALNGAAYQESPTFNGLAAGIYTVTIRNANGCTADISAVVTQPSQLSLQVLSKTDILCAGDATGNMQLQAAGSISPYLYSMDGAVFQTSSYYGPLPAGNYTIIVKDNNGCTGSFAVPLVSLYPPLNASLNAAAPATCDDKGTITVTNVQGGLSPYVYSLDNADYTSSPVFSDLYNGDYTVYIRDVNGCTITRSIAPYGPVSMRGTLEVQPVLCIGEKSGSIKVTGVTGGNNVYEYSLDGVSYQPTDEFLNLKAGVYQVHVRDVPYSCQIVLSGEVKEPSALTLQLTNNTSVTCFNGSNGTLAVRASGGSGGYLFSLNTGSFGTASTFGGLSAGDYTIMVKDANGCVSEVAATVTQPAPLTAGVTAGRDITCFGNGDGALTLGASGGTVPYRYSIDGLNYQSSPVFAGLQKGNYAIQVKDNNGCLLQINGAVAEPDVLQLQVLQTTGIDCFGNAGGKISIAGAGGSGAYTYMLNNLPPRPEGAFDSLTAGNYLLSVNDANGCTARQSLTLLQPPLLRLTKQVRQPACSDVSDGSIALSVGGGVAPYTYGWSNDAGAGNTLSSLSGGLYKVTVTDANGCWLKDSTQLDQPAPVQTGIGFTDTVLCVGQSLVLDAGNPGAAYSWISDAGFNSTERTVKLDRDGHYKLIVTSATGCVAQDSFTIQTSVAALKADFLLSSYGTAGDTVIVVDVSKPAPSNHGWTLPTGAREAGTAGAGGIRQLIFDQPGEYIIKMLVTLGECADVISKSITILPAGRQQEADSLLGYRKRLIREITAYPNPSEGPFKIKVKLSKAADIQLKLISFNNGNVLAIQKAGGNDYYEMPFDASLVPQGIYLVAVEVEKEYQVIRVLKI